MGDLEHLILGGGIAGLATAWHLTRAGATGVALLEREAGLGTRASGENAAILRTFGADPVTNAIARAAGAFLRAPERGFSPHPLVDDGGLLLLAEDEIGAELAARAAREPSGARAVGDDELARRAPHVDASGKRALAFDREGRLDVAAELDGLARGARAVGAELRTRCEVVALETSDGGRRVAGVRLADGSRLRARRTILAAGGWSGRLGAAAGSRVALRPTRRHLLVTAPDDAVDPDWPVVWFEDEGFYCRPESGGLLLSACDTVDADPDAYAVDPEASLWIAEKAQRLLPRFADAGAAHLWCGLRTLTADGRFAVGYDPDLEDLFWVAGLGGHGMSCGPEVGRLASLALLERERDDADRALLAALDPARLATPRDAHPRSDELPERQSVGA